MVSKRYLDGIVSLLFIGHTGHTPASLLVNSNSAQLTVYNFHDNFIRFAELEMMKWLRR